MSLWTDLQSRRTTALLIVKNDRIVFERYAEGYSRARPHYTASMAKALVGGVSFAVALSDGRISLDDAAARYISRWRDDPVKSKITMRELGSHTSGLSDAEADGLPHDQLTGWKGDFWKRLPPPNDPFSISREITPVLFTPGTSFQYSNPGMAMFGYALTAALKGGPQDDLRTLLRDRVMRPLDVPDNEWSVGYGQTFDVDGFPLVATWGGGNYSPGAVARVGRLMLRRGNWESRQLMAAAAIERVTSDAGTPHNGAMGWWSNNDGTVDQLPKDAFWGSGAGHQVLLVVPSLNLIAVRNGEALNPAKDHDKALFDRFFIPLMESVQAGLPPQAGQAPYPHSPIIRNLIWAPKETIVRKAKGSDNWPTTWADDDLLYAAYGDGNGFEPFVPEKLSLGLAAISGSPAGFAGVNVRSSSLEQKGDGKNGKKASGLLMVNGVLYLWARNAGNSQLAWSSDHGATWTWGWKFSRSFGCPVFLNFRSNYSGARDGFVYLYSPDSDDAYTPADRFVMARVPKGEIRERDSYEFFARLEKDGSAAWTKDIDKRGSVFTHPGNCWRSGISYNAGLTRYLWCQTLPASRHPQGPRFQGGFGIYDAPEPWGPWTTVFFTNDWDVGPGESSSFPTKWMSADGRTVHLVFSGDDSFSVRKAALAVNADAEESRKSADSKPHTRVSIKGGRWYINNEVTYRGAEAEGLLLNVRMVNAVFEDRNRPGFDPEANSDEFIARIADYVAHGVRALTLNLQGGMPGYEGAVNSAFNPDGSLRDEYLRRVRRVVDACDRQGAVVILGCYYQRQDQRLRDDDAVSRGVAGVVQWIQSCGFGNVVLEIANQFNHSGFDHSILKTPEGEVELIRLAKRILPGLQVSTSGLGNGSVPDSIARASDFVLIHFNSTPLEEIPRRILALKQFGKPIVCNEDPKWGEEGARAAELSVANGASWGLMREELNQRFPFQFNGAADDPAVYAAFKSLASPRPVSERPNGEYFPPPESQGGWRKLDQAEDIRRLAGMDPEQLAGLREWLLKSDDRNFAADVIRHGYIVLEVERGNSARTDARRVASVSKAVCATVLSIASEQSLHGLTPRRMSFDDPAFDFIPWARPLSDPRKSKISVKQLLNHTSGICPEATGAPNWGTWEYVLGHSGDRRTAELAFDPGTACGYSTLALDHASLVCEYVTGKPYDQFAVEALFKPLGIEHWWFEFFEGGPGIGRHPTHGLGMPARDLARIAYCMLHGGRWNERQVIPKWFVDQTAAPTHNVRTPELRWKLNPQIFSHGWELPARLTGEGNRSGEGIPQDARDKPGSGGQMISFVPSLDLVITRQTGGSGDWSYEEFLRRACAACTH